jgi:hypothetical protein
VDRFEQSAIERGNTFPAELHQPGMNGICVDPQASHIHTPAAIR